VSTAKSACQSRVFSHECAPAGSNLAIDALGSYRMRYLRWPTRVPKKFVQLMDVSGLVSVALKERTSLSLISRSCALSCSLSLFNSTCTTIETFQASLWSARVGPQRAQPSSTVAFSVRLVRVQASGGENAAARGSCGRRLCICKDQWVASRLTNKSKTILRDQYVTHVCAWNICAFCLIMATLQHCDLSCHVASKSSARCTYKHG
jgi:hypothetical protein